MSPTIIVHQSGRIRLVGGGSGGPRIITATAQVILNYLGKGYDILSAVKAPRLHSQLLPETVFVEQHNLLSGLRINNLPEVSRSLEDRGHNLTQWQSSMGVCQFITVDPDTGFMVGVSDPRKNGQPRGVQV
jgi:gamma-glutamyltranspeptidase